MSWRFANAPIGLRSPLVNAARHRRLTEGRLDGFHWAPYVTPMRGQGEPAMDLPMADAIGEVKQRAKDNESVDAQRALALAKLASGDVVAGADALVRAARSQKTDASLWSDASAARLEQARRTDDVRLVLDALALADDAIEIDGRSVAARFNRALALEKLGLIKPAVAAYRQGMSNETDQDWLNEVKRRIPALSAPTTAALWSDAKRTAASAARRNDEAAMLTIVRAYAQQSRTWAEGECLAYWSDAVRLRHPDEAQLNLSIARLVGRALRRLSGEGMLDDAVSSIDRASGQHDGKALQSLVDAHDKYRRGRIALASRTNNAGAAADLRSASQLFARGGSPMAEVARYFEATAQFESGDATGALISLRGLRSKLAADHIALRAQTDWEIGTVLSSGGDLYDGLKAYESAWSLFEHLGETEFAARMRMLRARGITLLGDPGEAWHVRRDAFAIASRSGNDQLLEFVLGEAALDEIEEHHWETARSIEDVAIRDLVSANPRRHFDIVMRRSLTSRPIDLRPMKDALSAIRDVALHADAENDLRFARAIALLEQQPKRAASLFSDCIQYEQKVKRTVTLPYLYLERARAHRRAGNSPEAIRDLTESISLFETRRQTIERRALRDSFIGTADDAFDELLGMYATAGDYDRAVSLGERRRGRLLLDTLGETAESAGPLTPREIAQRIGEPVTIVIFTTAGDRVLATTIAHKAITTRELPMSRHSLGAACQRLRDLIEHDEKHEEAKLAESLYNLLMAPTVPAPSQIQTLVIVADAPLQDLPFASLRTHGHYLLENATIVHAVSASAYVQSISSSAPRRSSVVAVGDPRFDRATFPALPPLPDAADEATEVARMYPDPSTLLRLDATFSRFANAARNADVIHIATHALTSRVDASASQLLFAADAQGTGAYGIRHIASIPLKKGCTVILAGCQTAIGDEKHGDLRNFAAAFLTAGAGSTVGTLWNVEDAVARHFSIHLHEELRRGVAPAAAVRDAQLQMLRSGNASLRGTRAWSGFQVYGNGN